MRPVAWVLVVLALVLPAGALGAQDVADARPPARSEIPALLATDEGRPAAMEAIRARATELPGPRATLWIQLLAVARKTSHEGGALAARAVLRAEEGDAPGGADLLEEGLDGVPEEDLGALLALAAHLADRGEPARAAALRERLLAASPEAPEAPEAQLRLARHRAGPGDDRAGAVELLEALIVERPRHPVAPEARRLLQQLRSGSG